VLTAAVVGGVSRHEARLGDDALVEKEHHLAHSALERDAQCAGLAEVLDELRGDPCILVAQGLEELEPPDRRAMP
jgi:hypothetical protein